MEPWISPSNRTPVVFNTEYKKRKASQLPETDDLDNFDVISGEKLMEIMVTKEVNLY